MTDLLSIGASGVLAYQSALTTTSENIANAGVAGYSRRTPDLREVAAPGSLTRAVGSGLGVAVEGVARASDPFRLAEVRVASAELARTETGAAWLERIDEALTGAQLGDRMTAFFNAAQGVAADPSATGPRAAMLEAASSVAAAFSSSGRALDAAAADLDVAGDTSAQQLTELAAKLATVNSGLARSASGSAAQANLLDARDRTLEAISGLANIDVQFDAIGRATVRLGAANGPTLVAGDMTGQVTYVRTGGAASFAVYFAGTSATIGATGGALAGIVESAQRIDGARTELNAVATAFTTAVNDFQAGGEDLFGNAGAAMFAVGATPTAISLVLNDPRGIAAASAGGGPRDSGNLTALASARGTGGFEGRVTDLVAGNASALSGRRAIAEAQGAIRDAAVAGRDAVSGVNLDEEAVALMRFQQAYQASSRVIQIARETFQTLFDIG